MTVDCELVTDERGMITHASPEAAALLAIEGRWLLHKPLANFVADLKLIAKHLPEVRKAA